MQEFDDNTKIPFGKYQGTALGNVPAEYLIWLYDNGKLYGGLKKYVEDNMQSLNIEIKQKENDKG
jgi:uncharacterized protein (DUF3820 family)